MGRFSNAVKKRFILDKTYLEIELLSQNYYVFGGKINNLSEL